MTSRRFPAPLKVDLKPSRCLLGYLWAIHFLLVLLVARAPAGPWVTAVLSLVLMVSAGYHFASLWRGRGRYAVHRLAYREGQWSLWLTGVEQPARLLSSWVLPGVVGLRLRAGSSLGVLVFFDSCPASDFRRLRQLLLLAPDAGQPGIEHGIDRLR